MKLSDLAAMGINIQQQKAFFERGVLGMLTVAEAQSLGYDDDAIKQLISLKKVRAQREKRVSDVKVTEKGAVGVYGLQRFPVTLYADQWKILLDSADMIRSFIDANASRLAVKSAE